MKTRPLNFPCLESIGGFLRVITLLMPSVLAADVVPSAGPEYGWDDMNTSVLNPLINGTAPFVLSSSWLNQAIGQGVNNNDAGNPIAEPAFTNNANWRFSFANPSSCFVCDFTITDYRAWVVQDPVNPKGDSGDVGGAVFSFLYTPKKGDPGFGDPGSVHFLQLIHTVTTYDDDSGGNPQTTDLYFTDNGGTQLSPFYPYQIVEGNSLSFFDNPDRCEPYPYGYGSPQPNCKTDNNNNLSLASIDWQAQTFVAVDTVTGHLNDVTLYGGPTWGFQYSNYDSGPPPAPEIDPGSAVSALALISGALMVIRGRPRCSQP